MQSENCIDYFVVINYVNSKHLHLFTIQYVNEVIIGAPYDVTKDLMDHCKVDIVVHGMTPINSEHGDPYGIPKTEGKFIAIDSGNSMTTEKIVERIIKNRMEYEKRNIKKEKKENAVIEQMQKQKIAQKSG